MLLSWLANLCVVLLTDDSQVGDNPSKSPLPSHHLPLPTAGSVEPECPCSPFLNAALSSSPSPSAAVSTPPADPVVVDSLPDTPSPASSPSSGGSEEEKAKKLLYCSLCKVAVNSLSQLEAHNKGKFNLRLRAALLEDTASPRQRQKAHSRTTSTVKGPACKILKEVWYLRKPTW